MRSLSRDILPLAVAGGLIAVAVIAPVRAADKAAGLKPATAQTINIGYVNGVAFYTAQEDGYHVVATLSVAGGAPIRVAATLQPEQAVSFSVPGAADTAPSVVQIARRGDSLTVTNPPPRLVLN
ncbi:hypothetical protein KHC23_19300 [Ancylobacter dichloromethanicus]|uniref:Uncharacterized protein n=1 Tax=Ancylobacter dichloromethanicus TaxID=518825 RepID=A0A9W6JBS0_9HYPH|nr:hypothetical protein [Ancylobacter dichloromethanicus]MBS7555784.1 hypothetical protein [Ancylobacter dichloromethanicus]GLK72859.1 hypothetical protein GCM10017643_29750 [Ancylobacter dichloromethanicus]